MKVTMTFGQLKRLCLEHWGKGKNKDYFFCDDCGKNMSTMPDEQYVMIDNELWRWVCQHPTKGKKKLEKEGDLCRDCIEKRLGRPLTPYDLGDKLELPINDAFMEEVLDNKLGQKHIPVKSRRRFHESENDRVYAYHCTNVDPEVIKREGWKVGMGFTLGNFFDDLDRKYLPKVPVYVTGSEREVWDTKAKYCIKLDITGLKLYPDFGSLPDTGAFYDLDEKYFHWYDESGIGLTFTNTPAGQKMKKYLESISPDEYILLPDDFTGEVSMRILGTAVVDGSQLTGRIVEYETRN